ncbi:hypothetical protein MHYP_G00107790 [Metynnis hypsauchen]
MTASNSCGTDKRRCTFKVINEMLYAAVVAEPGLQPCSSMRVALDLKAHALQHMKRNLQPSLSDVPHERRVSCARCL